MVIVNDYGYELYYDHWAANSLDSYLFWGSEPSITWVKSLPLQDESGWLDTVWCEGGAVIDSKKKCLVFFGGEDILYGIPMRRMYLKLMSHNWPGWEIRWANRGILDLADYVGHKILPGKDSFDPPGKNEHKKICKHDDKYSVGLVSVSQNGNIGAIGAPTNEYDKFLAIGDEVFKFLLPNVFKKRKAPLTIKEFPMTGVHFDIDAKKIFVWTSDTVNDPNLPYQDKWPGWEFVFLGDTYEAQTDLLRGKVSFPDITTENLLSQIKSIVCRNENDPLDTVALMEQRFKETGKSFEVNPAVYMTAGFKMPVEQKKKRFAEIVNIAKL